MVLERIVTFERDKQLSNMLLLILDPPCITTCCKDVQNRNTSGPSDVTEEGTVRLVNEEQLLKAA